MQKRRILIVDDEDDIRAIIRSALMTRYEVVEARDGLDALSKLDLAEPDFVILDVMMPLMDGVETCAAIRKHPRFRDISVLFLSALNTKDDMKRGYGAGANLYLTKPFDPSRLLRNVDLFFETNPPPVTRKRHTVDEIRDMENRGPEAISAAQSTAPIPSEPESKPAAAPAPAAPAPARPASASTALPRVLAIDDEEDMLTLIRMGLGASYEVVTAVNGIDAIEKITCYQPDIILLDAMLPKMSGYQLCQSLRRNARYSRTPVLFVSAKSTPRDREYAFRVGANEFLAKPFSGDELRANVKKMESLPGFVIHSKSLSMIQISDLENLNRRKLQEHQDRLTRKQETDIDKFLKENP